MNAGKENFEGSVPAWAKHTENAIVITDAEGRVIWFNPSFKILCGYEFDEIKGKKPGSVLQGAATDPEVVEVMRKAIKARHSCSVDVVNYHKDGHPYSVHIRIEPIRNEGGNVVFFAAIEREFKPEEVAALGKDTLEMALQIILKDFIQELMRED